MRETRGTLCLTFPVITPSISCDDPVLPAHPEGPAPRLFPAPESLRSEVAAEEAVVVAEEEAVVAEEEAGVAEEEAVVAMTL